MNKGMVITACSNRGRRARPGAAAGARAAAVVKAGTKAAKWGEGGGEDGI